MDQRKSLLLVAKCLQVLMNVVFWGYIHGTPRDNIPYFIVSPIMAKDDLICPHSGSTRKLVCSVCLWKCGCNH